MTHKPARRTSSATTAKITHDVTLWCVDPWDRAVQVPTTLGYRVDDPYAVSLTFHSGAGDVEWVVARNLVLQGLGDEAGEGDVRMWPSVDDQGDNVTVMDFSSPDGELIAHADSCEIQLFLARSFALVPVGAEADYIDMDLLIADLLKPVGE